MCNPTVLTKEAGGQGAGGIGLILADESFILVNESFILADESFILVNESLILADESLNSLPCPLPLFLFGDCLEGV
ncbi:hypothetical protein [Nostoc sp.]|uniref:hypothetical protein n=1 Tax=Nostoc sp. TaxID=1180 RepID=UPI002FF4C680